MKQKIFSLLVLLMAAVTGAWADDDLSNKIWKPGDTFNIGKAYFYYSDQNLNVYYRAYGSNCTVPSLDGDWDYLSDKTRWFIASFIDIDQKWNNGVQDDEVSIDTEALYMTAPAGKQSADIKPAGFKIVSGAGTKESPYTFGLVYEEATFDYAFTVVPAEYGSGKVQFFIEGNEEPVENAKGANEGDKVTMTITPDAGWIVDDTKVKAESYSTWEAAGAPSRRAPGNIQILGDVTLTKSTTAENTWTFTMPAASVLVSAGYIKSSTLYFDPADKTNLVTVTVDGTDRNLNGSKTVKIKRVDNVLEGTAVSLKANDGYKFRKVQVTKTDNGLKLTNPTVGQVIGSDGKNYAYASLPTGVTAVAKICYVSGNSGLALALADESSMMDWATAIETCAAHTPAFKGAEWKLASQDEWNNMKSGAGNYANLRNGFSSVGGTDMRSLQEETYWSSTEQVNSQNAWYMLNSGNWYRHDKSVTKYVRACLAF